MTHENIRTLQGSRIIFAKLYFIIPPTSPDDTFLDFFLTLTMFLSSVELNCIVESYSRIYLSFIIIIIYLFLIASFCLQYVNLFLVK